MDELTEKERSDLWAAWLLGSGSWVRVRDTAARIKADAHAAGVAEGRAGAARVTGAELIAAERRRQIEVEGWTAEHDREHGLSRLLRAAEAYEFDRLDLWPWDREWWKPKDALSNLIRAGALYQAADDAGDPLTAAENGVKRCAAKIDGILDRAAALAGTSNPGVYVETMEDREQFAEQAAADAGTSPQPGTLEYAQMVAERYGDLDDAAIEDGMEPDGTSPQGEGERLPDDAPWPREECGVRGPRIGEDVTRCRRSKGHRMPHRTAPSDGHGNVEWSDLADPYDYRDDATREDD